MVVLKRSYQSAHDSDYQVHRAMSPNHDNIAIGDTGVAEMVGEDVGCLVGYF